MNPEYMPSSKLRDLNVAIADLLIKFQNETGFIVDGVEVAKDMIYNPEKKHSECWIGVRVKIS